MRGLSRFKASSRAISAAIFTGLGRLPRPFGARNDKDKGFTLAEILVVMTIVGIVGVILVLIFTNTLRGSNKSQILAVIKQNGQAVLDNMDKTIRGADNVVCPETSGSSDTLAIVKNGVYTRFKFFPATSTDNGMIQQENSGVYLSTFCTDSLVNPITLTDTNQQSGVSVSAVSNTPFTRDKQAGSNDSVTVKFQLSPAVGIPAAIVSQIDPVTFQTTIELRNN